MRVIQHMNRSVLLGRSSSDPAAIAVGVQVPDANQPGFDLSSQAHEEA